MTLFEWIGAGALNFCMSLLAFVTVLHYDFEGWWQQHHIRKGKKLDPMPPTKPPRSTPQPMRPSPMVGETIDGLSYDPERDRRVALAQVRIRPSREL